MRKNKTKQLKKENKKIRLSKKEKEAYEKMKEMGLENILEEIAKVDTKEGISVTAAVLLNALMKKEREIKLRESIDNKANGYYERELACFLGNLGIGVPKKLLTFWGALSVPRDRKGEFRPATLPPEWQRADESFQDFVFNLVLQSYSPNKIKSLLQSMNLPYSAEQIEEIKEDLYNKAKEFKTKEIPSELFALFIDAYHTSIKDEDTNRVRKAVIYSVIGIDFKDYMIKIVMGVIMLVVLVSRGLMVPVYLGQL